MKFRKPSLRLTKKGVRVSGGGIRLGGKSGGVNISRSGISTSAKIGKVSVNSRRGCSAPLGIVAILVVALLAACGG